MGTGQNPYILFLILILLVFGSDPEASRKIGITKTVIDKVTSAMQNFHAAMLTVNNDFGDINTMVRELHSLGG